MNRWAAAEVVAIALILAIFSTARVLKWQQRMIDYRLLAEWLRHATPLALLGTAVPRFQMALPYARHDPGRTWVRDYFRQRVRQTKQATAANGDRLPTETEWKDAANPEVKAVKDYLLDAWVRNQLAYHRKNRAMATSLHEVLNAVSLTLAAATVVLCLLHFFVHWTPLGILTATLPAAVGACHAIATQAELRRLIDRSAAMEIELRAAERDLRRMIDFGDDHQVFVDWAQSLARVLIDEVNEWRAMFVLRPAEIHL